jgi:hypothetical protein
MEASVGGQHDGPVLADDRALGVPTSCPPFERPIPPGRDDTGRLGCSDTLPLPHCERAGRPSGSGRLVNIQGLPWSLHPPRRRLGSVSRVGPRAGCVGARRAPMKGPSGQRPPAVSRWDSPRNGGRLTQGAGPMPQDGGRCPVGASGAEALPGTRKILLHKNHCAKKGMGGLIPKTLAVQSQATGERFVRTGAEGSARSDRTRRRRHPPGADPLPSPPGPLLRRVL